MPQAPKALPTFFIFNPNQTHAISSWTTLGYFGEAPRCLGRACHPSTWEALLTEGINESANKQLWDKGGPDAGEAGGFQGCYTEGMSWLKAGLLRPRDL